MTIEKEGPTGRLIKLITSYIVFQDDIVMIDRVVDKVNLGCEHMVEVKFQLFCHLKKHIVLSTDTGELNFGCSLACHRKIISMSLHL